MLHLLTAVAKTRGGRAGPWTVPATKRSPFAEVVDRLAEGWTPEQISGWLKARNERRLRAVGCETIYAFIYRAAQRAEQSRRYLTRRHKRRRPRRSRPSQDTIKDRVSIHERPKTDAFNRTPSFVPYRHPCASKAIFWGRWPLLPSLRVSCTLGRFLTTSAKTVRHNRDCAYAETNMREFFRVSPPSVHQSKSWVRASLPA